MNIVITALVIIIGFCIINSLEFDGNINPILITLLIGILIFLVKVGELKEKYVNIDENLFTGIRGKSTMDNLQSIQDREIMSLEKQVELVKNVLADKSQEIESRKYRKIPIKNSCVVLNTDGTTNIEKIAKQSSQNLPLSLATDLNKKEMTEVIKNLNQLES